MKKQIIAWLLVLCLLLAAAPAVAEKTLLTMQDDTVMFAAQWGKKVALIGESALYLWAPGSDDMQEYPWVSDSLNYEEEWAEEIGAFSYKDGLYLVRSIYTDEAPYAVIRVYEIALFEDGAVIKQSGIALDSSFLVDDSEEGSGYFPLLRDIVVIGDVLYCLEEYGYSVYALPLDGSAGSTVFESKPGLLGMTRGKGDRLLLAEHTSPDYSWDEIHMRFCMLDPATGKQDELCTLNFWNNSVPADFVYADGRVYYQRMGMLYSAALDTGVETPVDDVPMRYTLGAFMPDGKEYMVAGQTEFCRRDVRKAARKILTISDATADMLSLRGYEAFMAKYPDTAAAISTEYMDDSRYLSEMLYLSGCDVYLVNTTNTAYSFLLRDADAVALEGNVVEKVFAQMDEKLIGRLSADGKIVALPLDASSYGISVNMDSLAMTDIALEEIPAAWDELLSALPGFAARLQGTSVNLFSGWNTGDDLRYVLLLEILRSYDYTGNGCTYDNAGLRSALETLAGLDMDTLSAATDDEDDYYGMQNVLFETGVGQTFKWMNSTLRPLFPTFGENGGDTFPMDMTVAIINPSTEHIEEARWYIECLADAMQEEMLLNISVTHDPAAYLAEEIQSEEQLQAEIGSLIELEKTLPEGDEKYDVQADIEWLTQWLEELHQELQERVDICLPLYRAHAGERTVALLGIDVLINEYEVWDAATGFSRGDYTAGELIEVLDAFAAEKLSPAKG